MTGRFFNLTAAALVAVTAVAIAPSQSAAQVSAADGAAFVGAWELALDAQGQEFTLDINVVDKDGMLAATVSGFEGGQTDVEDIDLDDGALVLEYETSAQGQSFPVEMTLTPDGDDMEAELDIADGMFAIDGTAKRK